MQLLAAYDWPGNVRELENAIERAVVVQCGEEILAQDLPIENSRPIAPPPAGDMSLAAVEKQHIQAVLEEMEGNISRTARALGIDRATLYSKIEKYGL